MGFIWTVSFLGKSIKGNKGDTVTLFYSICPCVFVLIFSFYFLKGVQSFCVFNKNFFVEFRSVEDRFKF